MEIFKGKGVSGGVVVGKIRLLRRCDEPVTRLKIEDTVAELARFERARHTAMTEIDELFEKATLEVGESGAQIFEIHKMMLEDEDFTSSVKDAIQRQKVNAEYAVALTADNFEAMLAATDDSYMQARGADVRDISNRLIAALSGECNRKTVDDEDGLVICADDLAPSETVALDKSRITAFVTSGGSANSHTVILARSMNIPAVIGTGREFISRARDGDIIIVNGGTGEVVLSPDADIIKQAEKKAASDKESRRLLEELKGKENITKDGRKIEIFANIGSADDLHAVLANDAGGIGLFRSEFLYLGRDALPGEDEQFSIYKRVLEVMGGKKVIIRTLDIGADKQAAYLNLPNEENPALGLRGIRLCLARPDIFRTQLRALFRASCFGRLGIMFPMISSSAEVAEALELSRIVKDELAHEGIPYSPKVEIGIMIETPAAALIAEKLAPMVDFFSVGTNDLTQYTLACDRQNPSVERYADPHHEAVLMLIERAAKSAHDAGGWIGICGELGADLALTERFLDMGIDELSVTPSAVLPLRQKVREI